MAANLPESIEELNEMIRAAEARGREMGRGETHTRVVDWFQNLYMSEEVNRGTPEADAILSVVRRFNSAFNEGEL